MDEYVTVKVGQKCPYLNKEYQSCEDAENYCEDNVSAYTHCGGLFGVEGHQLDSKNPVVVSETDEVYMDDEGSPMYDQYVKTFEQVR